MKLIIANWKSNKNLNEATHWLEQTTTTLAASTHQIVVAPPSPFLSLAADKFQGTKIKLAVQDISPFPAGAYTGAVGVKNLEGLKVSYAIVGHSERRRYFHENNNDVANKVRESFLGSLTPVVCVTKGTYKEQAKSIENEYRHKAIVAFEPVEHIGTGIADTLEDILETKDMVKTAFGDVRYIYGGSVDTHTDLEILTHADIDGFLVGGASLDADEFVKLVNLIS